MRYKIALVLIILYTLMLLTFVTTISTNGYNIEEPAIEESIVEEPIEEEPIEEKPTEPIVEEPVETEQPDNFHSHMSCDWDSEDSYMLAKIAMAEAEGEDIEGKAYVIMVVLNRVMDDRFPDTIRDVIFAKNQFTPISDGRYYSVEPNEECWEALRMVMVDKWDKSQGALYFERQSSCNTWHSRNLEYLFTHGNHKFYK